MPTRPMLLVAAVAGGDYLLWTWSSDGGSATIALISGLALAPLILALLWLLSVTVARILFVPRSQRDALDARRRRARRRRVVQRVAGRRARQAASRRSGESAEQSKMDAKSPRRSSEKIAA
ncbi:MAG TPA: hypothetical protein VGP17_07665 [Solirubrobacteraceae bacterium]|nr:hypothetical protein [Solirubrobacteraceae bacterium]